jgi:putative flippase GtrA
VSNPQDADGASSAPQPRVRSRWQRVLHEVAKFGVVGGIAYVVDVGIFNILRFGVGLGPLTSKTISTVVAVTVAYFGNRNWTWRERTRSGFRREYMLFFVVNGAGLAIQLAVLGFTVYVLKLDGQLAENIAGNVIGVLLGTVFRFWAYRTWVFPQIQADPHAPDSDDALEATTTTPY